MSVRRLYNNMRLVPLGSGNNLFSYKYLSWYVLLTTGTGTGRDIKRIAKPFFGVQMLVLPGILTSK